MTEQQLAEAIENAVNNYAFNPNKVAEAITLMHRTNQQSVWRLVRAIIRIIGSDNYAYDARNQAAHEDAKAMLEYLAANGRSIPMV